MTAFTAPPAAPTIEKAAALTLFGIWQIRTTSYSPNASQPPSIFPPSFSTVGRMASMRFCGFLTIAPHASGVYAACNM